MKKRHHRRRHSEVFLGSVVIGSLVCLLVVAVSTTLATIPARDFEPLQGAAASREYDLLLTRFEDPSFEPASGGLLVGEENQLSLRDVVSFDLYNSDDLAGITVLQDKELWLEKDSPSVGPKKTLNEKNSKATAKKLSGANPRDGFFLKLSIPQTLDQIGAHYNVDPARLAKLNDLNRSVRLQVGATIFVPSSKKGSFSRPTLSLTNLETALVIPANGRLTSGFGFRRLYGHVYHHDGIDIANNPGTPIVAAADGVVTLSDWKGGYGRTVELLHGGDVKTLYGHCSRIYVKEGQSVKAGQVIALMGSTGRSTGPHLHFEVHLGGRIVDPLRILDVRKK